jgi:hypothetical protein
MREKINLGQWTEDRINELLDKASFIDRPGERIAYLSENYLNTKYKEATLIGSQDRSEVLVIDLEQVDCLTFIEYIEAMRISKSFSDFKENLKRVRYRSGSLSFTNRKHFFTDWKAFHSDFVVDVTREIGGDKCKEVSKRLNEKQDGMLFVPGVSCRLREIVYFQSIHVDDAVMSKLRTGDYSGIYSKEDGLDVSHTGIFIGKQNKNYLRHASSVNKYRKVIDEDFQDYLTSKAGIIVLRPRDLY